MFGRGKNARSRLWPWLKRIIFTFLFVFVMFELVGRLFLGNMGDSKLWTFNPGDGRRLALKPGSEAVYTGFGLKIPAVRLSINEFGYRGEPRPPGKPTGATRVLILGDSYAFGTGVEEQETAAYFLEQELSQTRDEIIQVLNFGLPAANLGDMIAQHRFFASRWSSDIVLLILYKNVLAGPMLGDNPTELSLLILGAFRTVYATRVARIAYMILSRILQSSPAHAATIAQPTSAAERLMTGLQDLAAITRDHGGAFGIVLLGNPLPDAGTEGLRSLLAEAEIPMLDVQFLVADGDLTISMEGHLNPAGNRRLAQEISGWLESGVLVEAKAGSVVD
jgi:hypothetical protein